MLPPTLPEAMPPIPKREIPKWPIFAFAGTVFIFLPLFPRKRSTELLTKGVSLIYNNFGVPGMLAIPFVSISLEKSLYDSYCAYHGESIYEDAEKKGYHGQGVHGAFPSGGASLPSFSLIETRPMEENVTFRNGRLNKVWRFVWG